MAARRGSASPAPAVNAPGPWPPNQLGVLPVLGAVSGLFGSQDIHGELIQDHNDWLLRVHAEHDHAVPASRQAAIPVDVGDDRHSLAAFPRGKNCCAQGYGRADQRRLLGATPSDDLRCGCFAPMAAFQASGTVAPKRPFEGWGAK